MAKPERSPENFAGRQDALKPSSCAGETERLEGRATGSDAHDRRCSSLAGASPGLLEPRCRQMASRTSAAGTTSSTHGIGLVRTRASDQALRSNVAASGSDSASAVATSTAPPAAPGSTARPPARRTPARPASRSTGSGRSSRRPPTPMGLVCSGNGPPPVAAAAPPQVTEGMVLAAFRRIPLPSLRSHSPAGGQDADQLRHDLLHRRRAADPQRHPARAAGAAGDQAEPVRVGARRRDDRRRRRRRGRRTRPRTSSTATPTPTARCSTGWW